MSCGKPHEIQCLEVLARLHEYLDREPEAIHGLTLEQIQHHLEECPPCMRQFGLEQMVRALVQRSCGCHGSGCSCGCMPSEALRTRIVTELTTLVDGERRLSRGEVVIERHFGTGPAGPGAAGPGGAVPGVGV
jgi:anti-sigma factor (TIGR02949 family)